MDMSESALQEVFQREIMTEESQQILSGMSKKRTLLERLSNTGPTLLSWTTMN